MGGNDVQRLVPTRHPARRLRYLEWLLVDDRTRRLHGLPKSDAEFAAAEGTTSRTLRRWKSDPAFGPALEARRASVAAGTGGSAPPGRTLGSEASDDGSNPASSQYETIRAQLARMASEGDTQAAAAWMKNWGEPYMAAERAEAELLFPDLDDDELVDAVLGMIGRNRVASWLAGAQ